MSPDPHMTTDLVELLPDGAASARPKLKAFVPIILGCDFGCTYCIVPKTRGPERSRPVGDVLGEIRALAQSGTREVMLLGQTVDAYKAHYHADAPTGSEVYTLADLLRLLEDVDGIERVRFTSPHPMLMDDALIDAVANCSKSCEWIHLPVQSGSDAVLKRMARRYNRARYLDRIARIRAAMPECAITTDVIVGFPGETEVQFVETLSLVEEVRFDGAYMFAYSPRPDTPAYGWEGEVAQPEKIERLNRLIATQNRISLEKNQAQVGREFAVLVEGPSERGEGLYTGYTRENKTCHLPGHPGLIGRTVRVRATAAAQWGFQSEPLERTGVPLPVLVSA
jgi:tRNA-2-methylthio-N6-dimethylallyladenosine synthase